MEDFNEMARLHSAGATVRHSSAFAELPTYKNEKELSADFIKTWVVPFYMEIGSYEDHNWIKAIKNIKGEITPEICLSLLGDFNWRTRLAGAYFSAVKGYRDLIEIIGVHLLKSEVCCVGHIYALVLTFFNTEKSVEYLNSYLDYYLTTPDLYFDQRSVLEASLYLDKINNTKNFERHCIKWNLLKEKRKPLENQSALRIAKLIAEKGDKNLADDYLNNALKVNEDNNVDEIFNTDFFDKQITILSELRG